MTRSPSASRRSGPARDYTNVGEVSAPVFARVPDPDVVFEARRARLTDLAPGHVLAPFLMFLADIAEAQHEAQAMVSSGGVPSGDLGPPLARERLSEASGFAPLLDWFVGRAASMEAPEEARLARDRLARMPAPARLALADAVRDGAYPMDQLGETLFVAAAAQAYLTRRAGALDAGGLRANSGNTCPACGSPPLVSMIVNWASAGRARYCVCPLCATAWNYVRIKCTSCGSTGGISYFTLEEQSKDVAVETCGTCRGYIKHLHQETLPELEPVADDVASFGLDMLVQREGFRRLTTNPLMVMPAAAPSDLH